jgi:aspartyl-tRNA(Asn)/glutamyl-tRNA(Gln) amidotransferase subunit B
VTWEIVVGIETHAQLLTQSKIFSGAATAFGAAPNTQASAVDIALPGVLPVLNRRAVELAIRFGLAVGGTISRRSIFARKNYFYPDSPKGYQISQYELPVVQGGSITIGAGDSQKTIRLTRAHLEEDAGKSLHEDLRGMSGIDLNRAGTPLLEIVSSPTCAAPSKRSPTPRRCTRSCAGSRSATATCRRVHFAATRTFRCAARAIPRLGTRCELKNLNSFRFMQQAIEFEAKRQIAIIDDGGRIEQETRLFDAERGETRSMRSKEDAQDYRYFPDPDLLPLVISEEQVERVRASMPELPSARYARFTTELALPAAVAAVLTSDRDLSEYFEQASRGATPDLARQTAHWIAGTTSAKLNDRGIGIAQAPVSAAQLRTLMARIADGTISGKIAKEVDDAMWAGEGDADAVIEKRGLRQISDAGALEKLVDEVLAANEKQVADYRSGKEKAFNSLVGQVMKASRGKANPAQVNEILRRKLAR